MHLICLRCLFLMIIPSERRAFSSCFLWFKGSSLRVGLLSEGGDSTFCLLSPSSLLVASGFKQFLFAVTLSVVFRGFLSFSLLKFHWCEGNFGLLFGSLYFKLLQLLFGNYLGHTLTLRQFLLSGRSLHGGASCFLFSEE